jgi:WS/DGAT/MGAT family acyltransferase
MTIERLNPLDAWFLYAEDDGVNHMHFLSLIFLEGPPPPYESLLKLVVSKLPLLKRYRQVIRTMPFQVSRPFWVDAPELDLEYHVRRAALPSPGDEATLEKLVSRAMAQRLDRTRPLWELWSIEGLSDGRWVLINKLHHAMVDGVSGADMVSILLDKEPHPEQPQEESWSPVPGPSRQELLAATAASVVRAPIVLARGIVAGVRRPRATVEMAIAGLEWGHWAVSGGSAATLNGPIGPSRRYVWTSYSLQDVKRIRRVIGGTVNDVVVATAATGFRDLLRSRGESLDGQVVRVLIPIALHARDARGTAVASGLYENRVTGVIVDLPVAVEDPLERARIIREQLAALKASKQGAAGDTLTKLAGFAPATFLALGQRAAAGMHQHSVNSVVSNVPGPQIPLYALGRPVLAAHPAPPIFPVGARTGVAVVSYNGNMHFGIIADYSTVPDVHVLRDGIQRGLEELLDATSDVNTADV